MRQMRILRTWTEVARTRLDPPSPAAGSSLNCIPRQPARIRIWQTSSGRRCRAQGARRAAGPQPARCSWRSVRRAGMPTGRTRSHIEDLRGRPRPPCGIAAQALAFRGQPRMIADLPHGAHAGGGSNVRGARQHQRDSALVSLYGRSRRWCYGAGPRPRLQLQSLMATSRGWW